MVLYLTEVLAMNKKGGIYLCKICGNKVELVDCGEGNLVCCGECMILIEDE